MPAGSDEEIDLVLKAGEFESRAEVIDCGACGYPTCAEFAKNRKIEDKEMGYTGPHCVMRMIDIGVALCSAAKTASMLNIDNRVQQRVGAAARAIGLIQGEVVMGIPVSITGKSIYYDRQSPAKH